MNALKALMRVRLASFRQMYLGLNNKSKDGGKGDREKRKTVLFAVLIGYVAISFGFIFFGNFSMMSEAFYAQGLGWVYFALYAVIDFAVMFVGTVFTAKTQLYEAKDNDLLLAMPLRPRDILISRLFMLWVMDSFIGLIVSAAAGISWAIHCPVTPMTAAAFLLIALVMPFFAVAVAALFGFLISLVTRRVRSKSLLTTVFSLLFLAAYMLVINRSTAWVEQLTRIGSVVAESLRPVFVLRWIGAAIAEGDPLCLLGSLACLLLPFAAAFAVLSATFIKNVTAVPTVAKKEYKETGAQVGKASAALFRKEAARFVSSSGYMLNAGLGAVMEVAVGVLVLVKMPAIELYFNGGILPARYLFPIMVTALCLLTSMTDITAPSVSLEGKSLWILQTAPLNPAAPLRAKLLFHCAVSGAATAIAAVLVCIAAKATPVQWAVALVLPLLFVVFEGLLGLLCNLKYPILDWENENQAIKTGMAVVIAMFGAMGVVAALAGIWFGLSQFMPTELALCADALLLAALDAVMYRRLVTKGAERFATL